MTNTFLESMTSMLEPVVNDLYDEVGRKIAEEVAKKHSIDIEEILENIESLKLEILSNTKGIAKVIKNENVPIFTNKELTKKNMNELRAICDELKIEKKRSKADTVKEIEAYYARFEPAAIIEEEKVEEYIDEDDDEVVEEL